MFHKVFDTAAAEIIFLARELAYIDLLMIKNNLISVIASRILPYEFYSHQNFAMTATRKSDAELEIMLASINLLSAIRLRLEHITA